MAYLIPAHFTGKSQPIGGSRGGGASGAGILRSMISILSSETSFLTRIKGYNSHSITIFSAMQSKKPDLCFIVVEEKEERSMAAFLGYKIAVPGLEELKSNMEYLAG
ncbi:hypothetical protein M5689_023200 [Euphorbia peplus]|nr:hypothetical protein M5689_023200 [Euphorbia peplus]